MNCVTLKCVSFACLSSLCAPVRLCLCVKEGHGWQGYLEKEMRGTSSSWSRHKAAGSGAWDGGRIAGRRSEGQCQGRGALCVLLAVAAPLRSGGHTPGPFDDSFVCALEDGHVPGAQGCRDNCAARQTDALTTRIDRDENG